MFPDCIVKPKLYYHFNKALAHVKPLPNAVKAYSIGFLIFPCSHASHNAMGTDAAVVLPYF